MMSMLTIRMLHSVLPYKYIFKLLAVLSRDDSCWDDVHENDDPGMMNVQMKILGGDDVAVVIPGGDDVVVVKE